MVWSIALHAPENWAVKKCNEKRITSFDLLSLRRVVLSHVMSIGEVLGAAGY